MLGGVDTLLLLLLLLFGCRRLGNSCSEASIMERSTTFLGMGKGICAGGCGGGGVTTAGAPNRRYGNPPPYALPLVAPATDGNRVLLG